MNQERREKAISWIKEEIRSMELAPELNGCPMTPEWAAQLEIMQTCLEAVRLSDFAEVSKQAEREYYEGFSSNTAHIDRDAWVSVKERLPEKDGWYLVYAPGYWGNSRIYGLDGMAYSNFKHNYKEHWGIERGISKGWAGIVTHWMPLPEPPYELEKRLRVTNP